MDITLPDTPQILLNTPPEISASDINLGEDLYINVSSSGYAAVINSVTLNGQSISKGSGGYNIYTSMMNFTLKYVDTIQKNSIVLSNGSEIPLGSNYVKEVKLAFSKSLSTLF